MSEVTATDIQAEQAERRSRDFARLRAVATRHGALVLGALTLWGVADFWALSTGWVFAEVLALLDALFVGVGVAYIIHEWGHFTGARLSGAISPVLKEPQSFFMFNFHTDKNSRAQFLAMSLGGPVANWTLAILLFLALPMASASQAMLVAATAGIAVSVTVFEGPVIRGTFYGEDYNELLSRRSAEIGNQGRLSGTLAGAIIWLLLI